MALQDEYTRITLRIPQDLHARLANAAENTSKSLNAEIIARLQESFSRSTIHNTTIRGDFVAADSREIADQVERRFRESTMEKMVTVIALAAAFPDAVTDAHRRQLLEAVSLMEAGSGSQNPKVALTMALISLKSAASIRDLGSEPE